MGFVFDSGFLCHLCQLHLHNPQIAQLHKLCMLIFQKLAVTQALRVYSPKISTVWERKIACHFPKYFSFLPHFVGSLNFPHFWRYINVCTFWYNFTIKYILNIKENLQLIFFGSEMTPSLLELFRKFLREGVKKNWGKAVRLTAWVDPPPPPQAVRKM